MVICNKNYHKFMKAVNLYILTREIDNNVLPLYEKCISSLETEPIIHDGELSVIRDLVDEMLKIGVSTACLDDWFYSFSIPQISKEFDLLKISDNKNVINIEIKGQEVDEKRITKQLIQNRYYLKNVAETVFSFTYMRTNDGNAKLYKLNGEILEIVSLEELKKDIEKIGKGIGCNVEGLFRPRDYLVSPINTPDRFLNEGYFLNESQESIKKEIINGILQGTKIIWGIKGGAGTGKTLLLYDIARELARTKKVCIIHSGMLSEGHNYLRDKIKNLEIKSAKEALKMYLDKYEVICVDESQRLREDKLKCIKEILDDGKIKGCIFSYDFKQCLSDTEIKCNIPERLTEFSGFEEKELTERIRTNKEMFSFIRTMVNLKDGPKKKMNYDCIDIVYANNDEETDKILEIYKNVGYKFITLTPSLYNHNNTIARYVRETNSHNVIGQEFDKVVVILDKNFKYIEDGHLQGKKHPNPDYLFPSLFYQNVTRAREKLCVIVSENIDVFEKLLHIKGNNYLDKRRDNIIC